MNLAFVFLEIVIIFQTRIMKNPAKFDIAVARILILLLVIKRKFNPTLTSADTAKGAIVCFAKPSDCVQNTEVDAAAHGREVTPNQKSSCVALTTISGLFLR